MNLANIAAIILAVQLGLLTYETAELKKKGHKYTPILLICLALGVGALVCVAELDAPFF